MRLLECVPNFSKGRHEDIIQRPPALINAIKWGPISADLEDIDNSFKKVIKIAYSILYGS